MQAFAV